MKRADETMMKSNDEIPSHHGSENEGTCVLGDYLNKSVPKTQQQGCLMKKAYTLKCSEKQMLLKCIAAIKRCFLK